MFSIKNMLIRKNEWAYTEPLGAAVELTKQACKTQNIEIADDDLLLVAAMILAGFAESDGFAGPSRRALKSMSRRILAACLFPDNYFDEGPAPATDDQSAVV